ncbi:MAG: signal transduction histidine kinase, nitrogen specific, NtrB, partial [Candidatus Sulfotelmatobacter sp.]|nr:signal transduction histidine kinase, nitrogen specific, NtrB [Candidatus Sulfotelmatobacter sp.]
AIIEASQKAAALTRQLLAYAGKGRFQIIDFDITRLVRSSADLIRVSIPKSVDLRLDVPRNLPAVRGDSSQIEQVLMNLVINAAEATEGRGDGRVSVRAGIRNFDAAFGGQVGSGMAPGRYVSITVRDNGCGMDEQTKEKIFDPFFTTKFTGRGLGLAAVQGILTAHKGTITVNSKPGYGSTFTVYLPCSEAEAAISSPEDIMKASGRAATVLIVDDEELVRAFTKATLERLGHRVLLAQNGCQALKLLGNHAEIDLVVLDIIMPVVGGVDAFSEMRKKWPDLAVLVASGYGRYEALRLGIPDHLPFIEKPYTIQMLATAVEKALRARPPVGES